MKIAIGADHAGYELKEIVKSALHSNKHEVRDFGTNSPDSVDYPDFAHPLSTAVEQQECELGILVCGSGNGVAMTANKHAGIRAAICWTDELSALARQHNNANVLCLPARFISAELAQQIVNTFLTTAFEGGRHANRVDKISC